MDLSKAFDTLNHNLFIAKLGAYGFERDSLSFMKSYLNDRQQLITILVLGKKSLQEFHKVQYFYIFINDPFPFVSSSNLSNYADDNTFYASGFNIEEVKRCLSTDFGEVTK